MQFQLRAMRQLMIGDNIQVNGQFTPRPGNTTEWIVEAPSYGYTILPLADFDHVDFVNACWVAVYVGPTGTCSTIAQGSFPGTLDLQRYVFGLNQILAAPDALNSDGESFTDYYFQPVKINPH